MEIPVLESFKLVVFAEDIIIGSLEIQKKCRDGDQGPKHFNWNFCQTIVSAHTHTYMQ